MDKRYLKIDNNTINNKQNKCNNTLAFTCYICDKHFDNLMETDSSYDITLYVLNVNSYYIFILHKQHPLNCYFNICYM